ncbi:protein kinase domain protein [Ichthyophthirius multifiliis]|uniref:non-specific serine/threonine protein kinase n=1 Tax=Ichthyophthirius multifiliis TaxID=5932 RepID=G0QN74_ICHMU|nr:protein kinase domain protein [Ichthyophthirius multifiliis]EGR33328.1 protein kinase domain protein [Ichthyophthirius multifiliis]|eukprot:XP_004037314.1 protein kinase domain protein [Ichthyophthirius multifiliis]
MGCLTVKQKNRNKVDETDLNQIRKPKNIEVQQDFWDDPQINDGTQGEHTISSSENIFYYYKFGEQLGSGSFGSVCIATPIKNPDKRVAIKTIKKSTLKNSLSIYIKREIDIFKSLDHPYICKFLETYMDKYNIYVVMEYCSGGTLKSLIYSRNNTEKNVAQIIQKLFQAVNYLHHQKIVHRDLKLENVIFTNSDLSIADIKIIDFGLSKKIKDQTKKRHTKVGSYQYMGLFFYLFLYLIFFLYKIKAPEVILNSKYDKEFDVWSLGCIMFALLAGELPFYDIKSIETANYQFSAPCWKIISQDAKNLIKQMLVVDTQQRITLEEGMKHSWFNQLRKQTLSDVLLPRQRGSKQLVLDRLLNYNQSTTFKREILLLMVKRLEHYENQTPKEIFKMMNKQNNGFISVQELKDVIDKLKLQEEQFKDIKAIEELVRTISNKKQKRKKSENQTIQKINYSEFLAATLDDQYYLNNQKLNNAFIYIDSMEKNYITKEDIIDMLAKEGRKLPQQEIENIFEEIAPFLNKQGHLNFQGFKDIMSKGVYKAALNEVQEEAENISSHDNSSDYESESSSQFESRRKKNQ